MSLTAWKNGAGLGRNRTESRRDAALRVYGPGSLRPEEQWGRIFREQTTDAREAAARILGDLYCYTATRKVNGYSEPRDQFYVDVEQLARALLAFGDIRHVR